MFNSPKIEDWRLKIRQCCCQTMVSDLLGNSLKRPKGETAWPTTLVSSLGIIVVF